ncbi:MAG TPA: endonuclease NucS [Hyphomicrobium sp.]|nr:endonuclease NucS [Hyphomicrobium sp.]
MSVPHAVDADGKKPANPLPLIARPFDEAWLQNMLFRHPQVLPVDQVEPGYGPLVPVCREMSTPSGFVDNLFVNQRGQITLVECKLWRNAESRRKVVAQLLDYAKDLTCWGISDLMQNARMANKDLPADLHTLVAGHPDALGATMWTDTVSRNLRLGKMLLLIVGDGIREETANLAAFLQSYAHLSFTLGLVEMPVYHHSGEWIFLPRIAMKTQIINRVVVQYAGLDTTDEDEAAETEAPAGGDADLVAQQQSNLLFWTKFLAGVPEVFDVLAHPTKAGTGQTIWLRIFKAPMPAWIGVFTSKGQTGGGVYAAFPGPKSDLFALGRRMYDLLIERKKDIEAALGGARLEWFIRAEQPSIIWRVPPVPERTADETCADLVNRTPLFMKVMRPALLNARREAEGEA